MKYIRIRLLGKVRVTPVSIFIELVESLLELLTHLRENVDEFSNLVRITRL